MKDRYNFTLSDTTIKALRRMAESQNRSMSQVIEDAVSAFERPDDQLTEILLPVYEAVSQAIHQLEVIRDYNEDQFTQHAENMHIMLNRHWDEIRMHPKFWEPKHPNLE